MNNVYEDLRCVLVSLFKSSEMALVLIKRDVIVYREAKTRWLLRQ